MAGTHITQGQELPQEVLAVTDYPQRPSEDLPIKIFLGPWWLEGRMSSPTLVERSIKQTHLPTALLIFIATLPTARPAFLWDQ